MTGLSNSERINAANTINIIHPFSTIGPSSTGSIIFTRGKGINLWDINGKKYLDFDGQVAVCNIGHGREEMAECIRSQVSQLEFCHIFQNTVSPITAKYAAELAGVTPDGINHFLFTTGGSESSDSAIKIVRAYWQNLGMTRKFKIISLDLSYHGLTLAMTSCSGREGLRSGWGPLPNGFIQIPSYHCYHCRFNLKYPHCEIRCAEALNEAIDKAGEDNVAAFIGEPVLGSGGFAPPPPEYYPRIREICNTRNILFIADEVITGFGRTGKFWGCQLWEIVPDIMIMAKGISGGYIPFGAVAVNEKVYGGLLGKPFMHGFTFSGHPVACAAASKILEILKRENLVERANNIGQYLQTRMAELKELPYVGDVRGVGMANCIELTADKKTKAGFYPERQPALEIVNRAFEQGLKFRLQGDMITSMPPYIITKDEIDYALDMLKKLIPEVMSENKVLKNSTN
jgi:putrescine aminotransferase